MTAAGRGRRDGASAPHWWTCPRCRLVLGAPVTGDDHARICLFCGKAWEHHTATAVGDELRVPRLVAARLSGVTV